MPCWGQCPDSAGQTSIAPFSQPSVIAVRELHLVNITRATVDEQQQIANSLKGVCVSEIGEHIRDQFQQRGFFKAEVLDVDVSGLDRSASPPTVAVTASVAEGDRYRLASIRFTGNKVISNTVALRKLIPIKDGDVFNIAQAREGITQLKDVYGELGFINFTPVPDFAFDEKNKTLTMKIDIDEGMQYFITSFHVRGADAQLEAHLASAWSELFPARSVYNARAVEIFFEREKDLFPPGAAPDRNLQIKQDNDNATLDIVLDLNPAP